MPFASLLHVRMSGQLSNTIAICAPSHFSFMTSAEAISWYVSATRPAVVDWCSSLAPANASRIDKTAAGVGPAGRKLKGSAAAAGSAAGSGGDGNGGGGVLPFLLQAAHCCRCDVDALFAPVYLMYSSCSTLRTRSTSVRTVYRQAARMMTCRLCAGYNCNPVR